MTVAHVVTETQIRAAGFAWPLEGDLGDRAVGVAGGGIDLDATQAALESARDYYQKQKDDAYAFKAQWGASDTSDFSDAHEENVHKERLLSEALVLLARIRSAIFGSAPAPST